MIKALAVGLIATVFAGALYEQVARRQDRKRFPQIGQSVDIGGRSLNLYCSGDGSPTVILESGKGNPGYSWVFVQREMAQFTRACWYDRAGYGWSDSGPYHGTASRPPGTCTSCLGARPFSHLTC